jgi:hypothetical protein
MKKLLQILWKAFKVLLIIAISPLIYLLVFMLNFSYETRDSKLYDGIKFDKQVWSSQKIVNQGSSLASFPLYIETDVRCKMYNDISTNYLKIGMKLEEVEELFGSDKRVTYCKYEETKCLTYELGRCYSGSLTSLTNDLVICFNKDQNLVGFGKQDYLDKVCKQKFYCTEEECKCTEIKKMEYEGISIYSSVECPDKIDRW